MRVDWFWPLAAALIAVAVLATRVIDYDFVFYGGYSILTFVVLASAWNILGGFTGYVNFGTAAFFALGAYSTIVLHKIFEAWGIELPLPVYIVVGGAVSGLVGFGTGYLTLRLRGVFFAIATLALAVVVETLITNWEFVGGSAGTFMIQPAEVLFFDTFNEALFCLMLLLSVLSVGAARYIVNSRIGRGLAAIRDDEIAAECAGVPTLRLKLISTTISGALMGVAGAPFPYYATFIEPSSAFGLTWAVNAIAMPMVGGTATWFGPVIGALVLGIMQLWAQLTISSSLNILIVGVMLVGFVILAPHGIVGLIRDVAARLGSK